MSLLGIVLALVLLVSLLNYLLATWLLPALDTGCLADSNFATPASAKGAVCGI